MLVPVAVDSPRRYTGAMNAIDERACGKPGCDNFGKPGLGQQLGLEPMKRRCQRRTAVPELWRPDEAKGWVRRHPDRVVEVFVTREPAVDRLPQEIRQAELGVQTLSGVVQMLRDECPQPQAFIQLAHQNETGVGGDPQSLERDLQKALNVN